MSNVLPGLPDTHDDQTPPEVARRNAVLASVMSEPASPAGDASDEEFQGDDETPAGPAFVGVDETPAPLHPRPVAPPPRPARAADPQGQLQQLLDSKQLEKISIEISLGVGSFEMEFQVAGVCINVDSIAFFIPKQVGKFKLPANPSQEIKVTSRGKTYQVVYVGGFFTFPNLDYSLLSFLIVDDEPKS